MHARFFLPSRLLWLLPAVIAAPARGDGGFFGGGLDRRAPLTAPGQRAVIIRDDATHEVLLLQTTYRGPAERFAWVVPVPGLPGPADVFEADPEWLAGMDQSTRPYAATTLRYPFTDWQQRGGMGTRGFSEGPPTVPAGPGGHEAPPVVVHERMEVGSYDVAILSAPRQGVLQGWLAGSGFQVPAAAGPVLDGYSAKGWHFVALRINPRASARGRPRAAKGRPLLRDVEPIGIRFPTQELVFPLAISRVSAAPVTALDLIVLDGQPVRSDGLPTIRLSLPMDVGPGRCYAGVVREALRQHGGRALLCEGQGITVFAPRRWNKKPWRDAPEGTLSATRLYGEVPRDAMVDLRFLPAPGKGMRLTMVREAAIPLPPWVYLVGTRTGQAFWALLGMLGILWLVRPRPAGGASADLRRAAIRWSAGTMGIAAVALLLVPPWMFATGCGVLAYPFLLVSRLAAEAIMVEITRPAVAMGAGALVIVPLLAWLWRCRRSPDALRAWCAAGLLLVCALAARLAQPYALWHLDVPGDVVLFLVMAVVFLYCAGFLLASDGWSKNPYPVLGRIPLFGVLVLFTLAPMVTTACNSLDDPHARRQELLQAQDQRVTQLTDAIAQFRDATGAYPLRLADLASPRLPATGLDASGNEVPLPNSPAMPLLRRLPPDPLTGKPDWLYDVRSARLVESAGYRLHITGF